MTRPGRSRYSSSSTTTTGNPSPGLSRPVNGHAPLRSEQNSSVRPRRRSTLRSRPGLSSLAHQGHRASCIGDPLPPPKPLGLFAACLAQPSACSVVVGVERRPTHRPMRKGVAPHRSSPAARRSRRSNSQAQMSAVARWNCCRVSSLQGVAHQNGHTVEPGPSFDLALKPANCERERG